jgi:hypothetical protein
MSEEIQLDSASFNKNYTVLKDTADWLSTQKEPVHRERTGVAMHVHSAGNHEGHVDGPYRGEDGT